MKLRQIVFPFYKKYIVIAFLALTVSGLKAQPLTVIKGKVTDATTNEPIPFANVVFKGTVIGTSTDFNGLYTISTRTPKDSLSIVFMGYKPKSKKVIKGKSQTIDFQLEPTSVTLKEVVIESGENPAWRIIRAAWAHKDSANKENLKAYECESYTRVELAANNLENFAKVRMTKSLLALFDSLRVSAGEEGQTVLPVFISETRSNMYYLKDPYRKKEYIKASKITGIGLTDGTTTTQYVGNTYQDYNFNDDWITIIDKDFVSPIARIGMVYYKYYLIDSTFLDNRFCYEIKVVPKHPQDLAFTGTIWITDTSFTLKRIVVEVGKSANLNFIERIQIQQDLELIGDNVWTAYRTRILVDAIQPTKNTFSFIGKAYMYNYNWVVNKPRDMKFYEDKIERADDYLHKPTNYWDTARPEPLDPVTLHIYDIVDTIKEIPKVKSYTKWGKILFVGYFSVGDYLEVGPWQMFYGHNDVEGNRFRVGVRTNYAFSRTWMLKTYFAYGTKDEKFKYNFMVERFISRQFWAKTGVQYKFDVEGMGSIDPFYEKSAIYSTSQQLGLYSRMNENRYYRYWISSDIFNKKFNERMIVTYRYFNPVGSYVFAYYDRNGNIKSDFNNFEIALESRFAPKEIMIINDNDRFSFGSTDAPIFTLKTIFGISDVLKSEFNYQRVSLNISQTLKLGLLGRTNYSVTATKIWGTVPYPLLNILPGNENLISSTSTYNLMKFFEFVNDESLEIILTHYFGGFFFNRVPAIRRLMFREIIGAKAVFGSMSYDNLHLLPDTNAYGVPTSKFAPLRAKEPYIEAFAGVENIMRVLRIDFIFRLTYLDEPYRVQMFGIKASVAFQL